jgi:tRNA(fMet)-specific endonuclease VapC
MSPLYLLDTNVVLAPVRGKALGAYINRTFGLTTGRPLISVVTHGEVRVLAGRTGWPEAKQAALQNALDALVTVDINIAGVIDAYVEFEFYSQQYPTGARNMGKNDLWIAATAKASGATLLTTAKDLDLHVVYIDPASTLTTADAP